MEKLDKADLESALDFELRVICKEYNTNMLGGIFR
jgi:hypothetical protein